MRIFSALLILNLVTSPLHAGDDAPKKEAPVESKVTKADLVGQWETTRFWGADSGDFIQRITMIFRDDGTFKATATLTGKGNSTYAGTYSIDGNGLRLKVPQQPDQVAPCFFRGAKLVLGDRELDSWMELKKMANPKTQEPPNQPKAEQPGAAQPATEPADKTPVNGQPSTPASKDAPQ
jgi:hypothetical protein